MTSIVQPSEDDLAALVKPYLALQAENTSLAFVIGIASPDPTSRRSTPSEACSGRTMARSR